MLYKENVAGHSTGLRMPCMDYVGGVGDDVWASVGIEVGGDVEIGVGGGDRGGFGGAIYYIRHAEWLYELGRRFWRQYSWENLCFCKSELLVSRLVYE